MDNSYYSRNADAYVDETVNADMEDLYTPFTDRLPPGARVLDAGCGAGRDVRFFLKKGYRVEAVDISPEMAVRAEALTGIPVDRKSFEAVDKIDYYDGIWCCASLLHVPFSGLPAALSALARALKPGGVLYASFKYGRGERVKNGRHFTDLDEKTLQRLADGINRLELRAVWCTPDVRPGRSDKWLNALLRRAETFE